MSPGLDAIVVGAGPNGLAAALTLAERGLSVRVYEASRNAGGGCRSDELTLPGFTHDVCSTVQALALVSPFFRALDPGSLGVKFRRPQVAYAHPLDDGHAAALYQDVDRTADGLGIDGPAWRSTFGPLLRDADLIWPDVLGPLRSIPRHPFALARFGLPALRSAVGFARGHFESASARALFAGAAAHSMRRLDAPGTAAFGLVLALSAHAVNWPVVEGGSGVLADALVTRLTDLGVEFVYSSPVTSLADLPPARVVMIDSGPRTLLKLAGHRLPSTYRRRLERFKYGPGVFKLDWALSEPVPWTAAEARLAGTVHLGGTMSEVAFSEAEVEAGRHPAQPYVLSVQSTLMDPTRAPTGQHTFWAYCHVPSGSTVDMTDAIENQIERFAPGFRDVVLHRRSMNAKQYGAYDENFYGGDINAGLASLAHVALGPTARWARYSTPLDGVYLCSSSTAPGGGVHGMCGLGAARSALKKWFPGGPHR